MTQKEKVLSHLHNFGEITSMEAFSDYGITRLAAVIFDLRADGVEITSHREWRRNRYGEAVRFARYTI